MYKTKSGTTRLTVRHFNNITGISYISLSFGLHAEVRHIVEQQCSAYMPYSTLFWFSLHLSHFVFCWFIFSLIWQLVFCTIIWQNKFITSYVNFVMFVFKLFRIMHFLSIVFLSFGYGFITRQIFRA